MTCAFRLSDSSLIAVAAALFLFNIFPIQKYNMRNENLLQLSIWACMLDFIWYLILWWKKLAHLHLNTILNCSTWTAHERTKNAEWTDGNCKLFIFYTHGKCIDKTSTIISSKSLSTDTVLQDISTWLFPPRLCWWHKESQW